MPCLNPLKGYLSRLVGKTGKRQIVFNEKEGYADRKIDVPCGQCIACRLEKSRQWAIRCMHEAELHEKNCFITLTYNNENLPKDESLVKADFQKFMKRMRKKYGKIRYFQCGEYGEKGDRPHYHAILFGFDFGDRKKKFVNGKIIEVSDDLEKIWQKGNCSVGNVEFESCAYVARYIMKKITGDEAFEHYNKVNEEGEIIKERIPEYTNMSRRPGIGREWIMRYKKCTYPSDSVVMRNREMKPPKYYDNVLEKEDIKMYREIKGKRKGEIVEDSSQRINVKEKILFIEQKRRKRDYET